MLKNQAKINFIIKNFSTNEAKMKSHSSKQWILRQMNDPYIEKAKILNYRCRSAFKLIEIDNKYKILKPGNVVIDIGAAPGSWTQIAVKRTNADGLNTNLTRGKVISVDVLPFSPIAGATVMGGMDFTLSKTQEKILHVLKTSRVNCILSDMAPNATGIKVLDQENIINLCFNVLRFSCQLSENGANLLLKAWDSANVKNLEIEMLRFYESVRKIKPNSSRKESAEIFLLAKNFKQ